MNRILLSLSCLLFVLCLNSDVFSQRKRSSIEIIPQKSYIPLKLETAASLQSILESAMRNSLAGSVKPGEIAATLIDLRDPATASAASIRGEDRIYPASVVKMFYMAALERQLEDQKIALTPELTRGLRDMIVDSSNEATQYILDVLTDTSSGSELPLKEFQKWQSQRNRVNRFYTAMGFANINVNQKTFCEDAYGVEQQSRNYKGENRNMLTTSATARLLAEIVLGKLNTPERTKIMMDLMSRDWAKPSNDPDSQAVGFSERL